MEVASHLQGLDLRWGSVELADEVRSLCNCATNSEDTSNDC